MLTSEREGNSDWNWLCLSFTRLITFIPREKRKYFASLKDFHHRSSNLLKGFVDLTKWNATIFVEQEKNSIKNATGNFLFVLKKTLSVKWQAGDAIELLTFPTSS